MQAESTGKGWTPAVSWSLAFLTLISVFNYLDRSLLGLLLPLIKADLRLSDTALGLISGLGFALFYTLLGVPIASLADRSNRRNIVGAGFALWSLMTALTGWVTSGWQLAACRFLMGGGEAAGLAPSQTIIADSVAPAKRPLALAIFTTASAISSVVLVPIAGWIAGAYGWRATFRVAGFAGLALSVLFFATVAEPARQRSGAGARPIVPVLGAVGALVRLPAYLWLLAGASFMGGALYAWATWMTAMLVRVHGFAITEIATRIAPLGGVIGTIGIVAAGWAADRLGPRDPRWRLWVPALICLACAPAYAAFLLADAAPVWMSALVTVFFLQASYQGPAFAAVIAMAPAEMRAVSVSIVVLFTGLVGQVFGPLSVGMLNDALLPTLGEAAIRYSLLVVVACTLLGGVCFLMASFTPDRDGGSPGAVA